MVVRTTLAVLCGLSLASCESDAERKQKWVDFCVAGEFSAKQCEVLYAIKQSSDAASTSATVAAGMSGAAAGAAAVRR
jgi:hypothetical protein